MTVAGLHSEIAKDSPELLHEVHRRRGYALSYHRMFQAHAPALLAAYDAYYQELTLRPRDLTVAGKETVWIALQAATREHHGMIHLRRAEAAGLSRDAIADALAIGAAVETWPVLQFGDDYWAEWTPLTAAIPRYFRMFEASIGEIPLAIAEITAIVCHAARRTHKAMQLHLPRAFAAGATPGMIAEGLSFLLLPAGGPCLIDAVQAWAELAETGAVPSPYLETAASS